MADPDRRRRKRREDELRWMDSRRTEAPVVTDGAARPPDAPRRRLGRWIAPVVAVVTAAGLLAVLQTVSGR